MAPVSLILSNERYPNSADLSSGGDSKEVNQLPHSHAPPQMLLESLNEVLLEGNSALSPGAASGYGERLSQGLTASH